MKHPYSEWIRAVAIRLDANKVPRWRLDELGWIEFMAEPPSDRGSLTEFVCEAVELCCFDHMGEWCGDAKILASFIIELELQVNSKVSPTNLKEVMILGQGGADQMDEIRAWFSRFFSI